MIFASLAFAADIDGGVAIRVRPEVRTATRFRPDEQQLVVNQNLKGILHAESDLLKAHVELQDVRSWGDRSSLSPAAGSYVHQGYLEVGTDAAWLRLGRQEMRIQKGLFVGDAPFNIRRRSFDALRGQAAHEGLSGEFFVTMVRPPTAATTDVRASRGEVLGGMFVGVQPTDAVTATAMLFAETAGPTTTNPELSRTWVAPGLRLHVQSAKAVLDVQGLAYTGSEGTRPIRATHLIARWDQGIDAALDPAFALYTDLSSGHACSTATNIVCATDRIQEPQMRTGRNHYLRGLADQMAGSNLHAFGAEASVQPDDTASVAVQGHWFRMANPAGTWRAVNGSINGFAPLNTRRDLAAEVDLVVTWTPLKGLKLQAAWATVAPLAAGRTLGGDTWNHVAWLETAVQL